MADPHLAIDLRELVWAALLGIGGFFMWLFKRSIYGRMDTQDERMDRQDERMGTLQTKEGCEAKQGACSTLLCNKIDAMQITHEEVKEVVVENGKALLEVIKYQQRVLEKLGIR
jgi:hypothetical protein